MGNATSELRKSVGHNDIAETRGLLERAGEGSGDLINEDYTSDCLFSCNRNVHTPLHTALGLKRLEMVELLLKHGADPESVTKGEETCLHRAARQNNLLAARLLVQYGADKAAQNHLGQYPIHLAALSMASLLGNNVDVLTYFLEEVGQSSDVTLTDDEGNTPLHIAAMYGVIPAVKYLAEHGSDLQSRNKQGQTPKDIATSSVKDHFEGWA